MVKKFFFKKGSSAPRRLFKFDLVGLYVPKGGIRVFICSTSGLFYCSLFGSSGYILIKASSADKLISVVRDCYRESFASRLYNNDFYNSLTFIFVNV